MEYPNGMTVAELKQLINGWPEADEYGEPCEVWVAGSNGLSNQIKSSAPLNVRSNEDDSLQWSDILFSF